MKASVLVIASLIACAEARAELVCKGSVVSPSASRHDEVVLGPMRQDPKVLMGKIDQFSFVADTAFLDKDEVALFIHDVKADYTAVTRSRFRRIGRSREASLKQIIGYETDEPVTLELACFR